MRIKKTSQTTPTQAHVINTYSTSTEDGYSCNYMNNVLNIESHTVTPVNIGRVSNVQCFSILNSIVFITGSIVLPSNIQANTWLKIAEIPSEIYPNLNTQFDGIIRNADNGNSAGTTLVQITTSGEIQIKPSSTITTPDLLLSICYKL